RASVGFLAACTALALLPGSDAPGSPRTQVTKDAQPGAAAAQPAYVINLTVSPAAAPVPALKYELLPRLRDRTAGNAALDYYRAGMLRPTWPHDPAESRRQDEMVLRWEEGPVEKLPIAEVKKFLLGYDATFRALDQAARCD